MARSHHRKKHKEHLQHYKHRNDPAGTKKYQSKGANVFAIVGAIFGLGVSYVASSGNVIWMIAGAILAGLAGYVIGQKIDKGKLS